MLLIYFWFIFLQLKLNGNLPGYFLVLHPIKIDRG